MFTFYIAYLLLESVLYFRRVKKIQLRITVSGTRGKTSIVRTLASVFRSNNITVLAKTTGSEAKYILPDGSEEAVKRWGKTSILEQKEFIKKAVKLKADCVISEIMSIHPECHLIETHQLLKPGFTIISNLRADHIHVAGESIEEVSRYFLNDVFPESTVFMNENEINEYITEGIREKNTELIKSREDVVTALQLSGEEFSQHISENLNLVYSASKYFGIEDKIISEGIKRARLDIGKPEIFRFKKGTGSIYFVNSFAANDPDSTTKLIQKILSIIEVDSPEVIGLLSLRADRGERSRQWLTYLSKKDTNHFSKVFLVGAHVRALNRKIQYSEIIAGGDPVRITNHILSDSGTDSVIFGIGNFVGLGHKLATYWNGNGVKI